MSMKAIATAFFSKHACPEQITSACSQYPGVNFTPAKVWNYSCTCNNQFGAEQASASGRSGRESDRLIVAAAAPIGAVGTVPPGRAARPRTAVAPSGSRGVSLRRTVLRHDWQLP